MLFLLIMAVAGCGVLCAVSLFVGFCAALSHDFGFARWAVLVALASGVAASVAYGAILSWGA